MASFGSAFSAARKAGKKTFMWEGKSYTTDMAGEKKPASSASSTSSNPTARSTPAPAVTAGGRGTDAVVANLNRAKSDVGMNKIMGGLKGTMASNAQYARNKPKIEAAGDRAVRVAKASERYGASGEDAFVKRLRARKAEVDRIKMAKNKARSGKASGIGKGGMAKGGRVSRGDGIAKKGKTKGRMM